MGLLINECFILTMNNLYYLNVHLFIQVFVFLINILIYLISVRSFQAVAMIYQILVFFVVISLAAGSEINLRKLYEDAEEKMDSELRSQMMAGMKSSRMNRKKFTA